MSATPKVKISTLEHQLPASLGVKDEGGPANKATRSRHHAYGCSTCRGRQKSGDADGRCLSRPRLPVTGDRGTNTSRPVQQLLTRGSVRPGKCLAAPGSTPRILIMTDRHFLFQPGPEVCLYKTLVREAQSRPVAGHFKLRQWPCVVRPRIASAIARWRHRVQRPILTRSDSVSPVSSPLGPVPLPTLQNAPCRSPATGKSAPAVFGLSSNAPISVFR